MPIREELNALFDGDTGLRCVSPLHRQVMTEFAGVAPDEALAPWREQVRLVEISIEPLAAVADRGGQPEFHSLCEKLTDIDSAEPFNEVTGLTIPEQFQPQTWFQWASQLDQQIPLRLYCIANFWLTPVPLKSSAFDVYVTSVCWAVQGLGQLEHSPSAVALMNAFLEIAESDFGSPGQLQSALQGGLPGKIDDAASFGRLMNVLTESLRATDCDRSTLLIEALQAMEFPAE